MARLVLSLDGQVLAEYNMSKERYTIGRLPDNDIRIDNPAVSGHHALIINILNDSFLEDLNSTNGTYVNGKIVKKHAMQHGDVITVGHHALRFVDSGADEPADEFEKTMVISPREAANLKVPGIRAGMAYDLSSAMNSREHNDTNVLSLGAGLIGINLARQIVKTWLSTDFGGERHLRRIEKITAVDQQYRK